MEEGTTMNAILTPSLKVKILLMVILAILMILVTTLVYLTGGVQYAYPHMMYLPIVIGGIIFGKHGGLIAGILGGLLLGPLMPVNVSEGTMQETMNWLTRLVFFAFIGLATGLLVEKLKNYFNDRINALRHIPGTNIPVFTHFYDGVNAKEFVNLNNKAIIYIDILNYNKLNDYLGQKHYHDALSQVYTSLDTLKPDGSYLYAKSTQGFIVFIPRDVDIQAFTKAIEETLLAPRTVHDTPLHIETAIGASPYQTSIEETLQHSIKAARYAAYHFYPSHIYSGNGEDNSLDMVYLGAVLDGLKNNDFHLVYQPQYDTKTKKIVSLEALLRWNHPTEGDISPNVFIPIIEETALINPLTSWVVSKTLDTVKILKKHNVTIPIAINISTKNLFYKGFFESIIKKLEDEDVTAKDIELEITESALMHNPDVTEDVLKQFRDYGISISLDDFGTGYSSLVYLKKFDVQKIKIDRAFITGLSDDQYSQTIVKTAVQLANEYNITTVAEGVETIAQFDILSMLGCTYIQGYLFSEPLTINSLIPLLNTN